LIRSPLPALALSALALGLASPVAGAAKDPTRATCLGDHRYDDPWPDQSAAAIERGHLGDRAALDVMEANVRRWMAGVPR
jgi:hypothetical protein